MSLYTHSQKGHVRKTRVTRGRNRSICVVQGFSRVAVAVTTVLKYARCCLDDARTSSVRSKSPPKLSDCCYVYYAATPQQLKHFPFTRIIVFSWLVVVIACFTCVFKNCIYLHNNKLRRYYRKIRKFRRCYVWYDACYLQTKCPSLGGSYSSCIHTMHILVDTVSRNELLDDRRALFQCF
ncbi:hypothetical protein QTP88_011076 [Uroleucon formosanum]